MTFACDRAPASRQRPGKAAAVRTPSRDSSLQSNVTLAMGPGGSVRSKLAISLVFRVLKESVAIRRD
jgi:hypothetical protein